MSCEHLGTWHRHYDLTTVKHEPGGSSGVTQPNVHRKANRNVVCVKGISLPTPLRGGSVLVCCSVARCELRMVCEDYDTTC